jgi:pimeloyl-ACP methyl ester carboxylesterase
MGGKVAQLVAATHPAGLRGLVLVASGPPTPPPDITAEYREGLSHAYDSVESVVGARDAVLTASELSPQLKAQVVQDSRASASGASTEWPLRGIAEDISAETRLIRVPTSVIAGERDQVEPVDVQQNHLLHELEDAALSVIPSTGHLIPLEAPTALAEALDVFVAGLEAGAVTAPTSSTDRVR